MAAPDTVRVTYRDIEGMHVFTSEDVRGLYVAGRDLAMAYEQVAEALHQLFKYRGIEASYRPTMPTAEFLRFLGRIDADVPHPSVIEARDVAYNLAA